MDLQETLKQASAPYPEQNQPPGYSDRSNQGVVAHTQWHQFEEPTEWRESKHDPLAQQ